MDDIFYLISATNNEDFIYEYVGKVDTHYVTFASDDDDPLVIIPTHWRQKYLESEWSQWYEYRVNTPLIILPRNFMGRKAVRRDSKNDDLPPGYSWA